MSKLRNGTKPAAGQGSLASTGTVPPLRIQASHLLLILVVMGVWGSNFVVIEIGLAHFPPLLFALLRFLAVAVPALFFVSRPAAPLRHLALYGTAVGGGQFGLLYVAMQGHISAGLASLVVQAQVFFTIGLSVLFSGERVRPFQLAGMSMAAAGLAVVAFNRGGDATALGLTLVVGAALSWAIGNMIIRAAGGVNMLGFVIWSSLFALPPLFLLSLALDGAAADLNALRTASAAAWAALLWQSTGNTLFGFAAWGWLLGRYPAATIMPAALLIPVFGIGSAMLFLGETMQLWKAEAAILVFAGLGVTMLWPLVRSSREGDVDCRGPER